MQVADFDFHLPEDAIAQRPAPRGTAKLLHLDRVTGALRHLSASDLPSLLRPGDVLVVNDTTVIPARLFGLDETGRRLEILLVRRLADTNQETWECLARPGRHARPGRVLRFPEGLTGTVEEKTDAGRYRVRFEGAALDAVLEAAGSAPLPPYIKRPGGVADARDGEDYQTVYAREPGAIAAPTAGLHFTDELLERVKALGVSVAPVTLHVGLGTFRPVKSELVADHVMDEEQAHVPEETARLVNAARREGRRVVAVGTTSTRTLEAAARAGGGTVLAGPLATRLFLVPGAEFLAVDALLTNFHLPRSTLVMLVSAFAGRENVLAAYREAVGHGYRFFSYGDAMFIS